MYHPDCKKRVSTLNLVELASWRSWNDSCIVVYPRGHEILYKKYFKDVSREFDADIVHQAALSPFSLKKSVFGCEVWNKKKGPQARSLQKKKENENDSPLS